MSKVQEILSQPDIPVDGGMINNEQKRQLIQALCEVLDAGVEGDVVELGCYVGESSKCLRRTLNAYYSDKQLYVYDSFEGLPPLHDCEKDCGWKPGTLKTTKEILIKNFIDNQLAPPIITKGWFKDINRLPDKICFAFLDGDFYDSIFDSLQKIYNRVSDGGVILFHDYGRVDLPGVEKAVADFRKINGIVNEPVKLTEQLWGMVVGDRKIATISSNSKLTVVTGIWNLRRDQAGDGFKRPFSHYIEKFTQLLKTDINMIIFIEKENEDFVWQHRSPHNTKVYIKEVSEFREKFDGYKFVQQIRSSPEWLAQAGWLPNSTQATLELYNPMVMSKMFMLHDASIFNPFNSDYFIWLDGGITSTVHEGYFTKDRILDKINPYLEKFFFISFPYNTNSEVHGFQHDAMKKFCGCDKVEYVCRGGLFGGHKNYIGKANAMYYRLLIDTLAEGYMGTEESIFTIMSYKEPKIYQRFMIEDNGLISTFAEALKNDKIEIITKKEPSVAVYVISFNSPKQFMTLVECWKKNSKFVNNTANYLLDNSTDLTTTDMYKSICDTYNFQHIKKDNLGICGGRQWVAEHFAESDHDYYIFLEDDMFLNSDSVALCKNGFPKVVPDIYDNLLAIMEKEKYDFLKMSFTEFFGDNRTQWAWYNVPQSVRDEVWPEKNKLPKMGLDPDAPLTRYKNIKSYNGIAYADGEIYYCNWPQIVSRKGNQKMFLDTKWGRPYEQTWMSYMFQQSRKGELNSAILLASPITHDRFDHYLANLRKES